MMRTFVHDHHYKLITAPESSIIASMKQAYTIHGWSRFGSFRPTGGLGFAYVLPKDKDPIGKDRPIIPATKHPLKHILNMVSRVWLFLIAKTKINHFNILATKDLKTRVQWHNSHLHAKDRWSLVSFDVKNMFTELAHSDVFDSLAWFLEKAKEQLSSTTLNVLRRGRGGVAIGNSKNKKLACDFNLKDLMAFAQFELNNTFFRVGLSIIMQQQIGIAMGGYQSPPFAMIVAICAEYKWLSSLGADAKYIRGTRYIDDGLVLMNAKGVNISNIVNQLLHCYPKGLELEITSIGYSTKILECDFQIQNCLAGCLIHYNKNADSITDSGAQKFKKFIPWASAHSRQQLQNVVLGLMHRMFYNTSTNCVANLHGAFQIYKKELMLLGYPKSLLRKCFRIFMMNEKSRNNADDWLINLRAL
jgi:hypothetical protein